MGCSLLSIVEVLYFIFIGLNSTLLKIFRPRNVNEKNNATLRVIQVTPLHSERITDDFLASINELTRNVEKIKQQNSRDNKKIYAKLGRNFLEIDQKFQQIFTQLERIEKDKLIDE
jgi:hypothetical protein